MDMGMFLAPSEWSEWTCLEQYIKQQLFQSLPLHTGLSLNCPGETAELWQNAVELASGKDLNTFKGPNTQVPAELSLSKQIVSQLLYKYVYTRI